MLRIKYKDDFLDLTSNQDVQLTKNSPLFLISNALAEYSTPISIGYTDKNARLLGFFFMESTSKSITSYDVEIYTDFTFRCRGTLVIEGSGMHNRFASKSTLTGYLLTGISSFFSNIQTLLLTDLQLGGERVKNFTTWSPLDGSDGYVQEFNDSFNFTQDYVTLPTQNQGWMNQTAADGSVVEVDWMNIAMIAFEGFGIPVGYVCLFPKLKFVIDSIFSEQGWSVDYSGIGDTDWERLILFSAKPLQVSTTYYSYDYSLHITLPHIVPEETIAFSLADNMPAGITCAQFLSSIFLRYGWTALCNTDTKTCSIIALKQTGSRAPKDWTKYAGPASNSDFSAGKQYYKFQNDFNGGDTFPSSPSFDGLTIGTPVNAVSDLPDANSGFDNTVIYVFRVNQWYQVTVDTTTGSPTLGQRIWTVFADNIYDDQNGVPDDTDTTGIQDASGNESPSLPSATINTIETACSTLPVYKTLYSTFESTDLYGWFPFCEQNYNTNWDIRTLLYHGKVNSLNADGTTNSTYKYPFGSSTICLPDGTNDLGWSNVFTHPTADGTQDYGIVKYWWSRWLNMINGQENNITRRFYLPLTELINFKWDDIILVNNVPYLISSFIDYPDYKGYIDATMQKVNLGTLSNTNTSGIYLKLRQINIRSITDPPEDYSDVTGCDMYIDAFSDPACTVPLEVSDLHVTILLQLGILSPVPFNSGIMSGSSYHVIPPALDYTMLAYTFAGIHNDLTYSLQASTEYIYVP